MNTIINLWRKRAEFYEVLANNQEWIDRICEVGNLLQQELAKGSVILACGNGGSAAEAQHLAGEIVGRFLVERDGLPAVALNADTAVLTAIGNDYGYDEVFARQVTAFRHNASVLIMISTSGNSNNLVKAAERARALSITTVGLLGRDGGLLLPLCDYAIVVPSWYTPEIQETQLSIIHALCELVDAGKPK